MCAALREDLKPVVACVTVGLHHTVTKKKVFRSTGRNINLDLVKYSEGHIVAACLDMRMAD
jgi:hypothetical protein